MAELVWLDSVGHVYVGSSNGTAGWMSQNSLIRYVQLKIGKSSLRWRIVRKKVKDAAARSTDRARMAYTTYTKRK